MYPFPSPLAAIARSHIDYRAKTTFSAVGAAAKPTGVAVGDLVFVLLAVASTGGITLTTASGSAWNRNEVTGSTGSISVLFWKVLVALDVSNAWNFSTGSEDGLSVRYEGEGATAATVKSTTSNGLGASSLSLTGFTPAAYSRGVIAIIVDLDVGATDATPTNFTSRHLGNIGASNVNFADQVVDYQSGVTVTFTGTDPGGHAPEKGYLVEVT